MYQYIIQSTKDATIRTYTSDVELKVDSIVEEYNQEWKVIEDIT